MSRAVALTLQFAGIVVGIWLIAKRPFTRGKGYRARRQVQETLGPKWYRVYAMHDVLWGILLILTGLVGLLTALAR